MSTPRLGNSDLNITPVGFGVWAIGGPATALLGAIRTMRTRLPQSIDRLSWSELDRHCSRLRHGTFVRNSCQRAERVARFAPYVFTKCVMRWDEQGRVTTVFNRDSIRRECNDSLLRLQVDVIDLYQMYWPPRQWSRTGRSLANNGRPAKRRKGPVDRRLEFHIAQIERAEKITPVISLQPPYSLIHRQIETETLPYCEKQGIGVIVYSPMASGLLTGALARERAAKLPDDDWRKHSPEFANPIFRKISHSSSG